MEKIKKLTITVGGENLQLVEKTYSSTRENLQLVEKTYSSTGENLQLHIIIY